MTSQPSDPASNGGVFSSANPSYVYFTTWNKPGLVKIGKGNLRRRIAFHQSYIPDLKLLWYIKCADAAHATFLEPHIHGYFDCLHQTNEIFLMPGVASGNRDALAALQHTLHELLTDTLEWEYRTEPSIWETSDSAKEIDLLYFAEEDPWFWRSPKPLGKPPRSLALTSLWRNPEFRQRMKATAAKTMTANQLDPEFREKAQAARDRLNNDPVVRKARSERLRARYRDDPAFRQMCEDNRARLSSDPAIQKIRLKNLRPGGRRKFLPKGRNSGQQELF